MYISREEGKIYDRNRVAEEMVIVVNAIQLWSADNNGIYPKSIDDISMKSGKVYGEYFIKPLEKSEVVFINDSIPANIEHGKHKYGSINVYIFGDRKKCVVVGYTYKDLPVLRSDNTEFKQYYKEKLKTLEHNK